MEGIDDDLRAYAEGLQIDLDGAENDLMWLVKEAFYAALPLSWSEHTDDEGRLYFFREASGESSWEHPMDGVYRELVILVKEARANVVTQHTTPGGEAACAQLVHSHLRQVHQRALESVEGWSGPYQSAEGEYYYNEYLNESVWDSPLTEWSQELVLRHNVLCRCLLSEHTVVGADGGVERLPEAGLPRTSGAELLQHLRLRLELIKRDPDGNEQPRSPSTSRDYHTARSGASTTRSQISSGDRRAAAAAATAAMGSPTAGASTLAPPAAHQGDAAAGGAGGGTLPKFAPKPPPSRQPPVALQEQVTIFTRPGDAAAS